MVNKQAANTVDNIDTIDTIDKNIQENPIDKINWNVKTEIDSILENIASSSILDNDLIVKESIDLSNELKKRLWDNYEVYIDKIPNWYTAEFWEIEDILWWIVTIHIKEKRWFFNKLLKEELVNTIWITTWKDQKTYNINIWSDYVRNVFDSIKKWLEF
jgi:hypothetical protein